MPQVAPFFIIKSQVVPFFIVTWPPNLFSSDTFKGISGPDSDSKLAPNIIDKYTVRSKCEFAGKKEVDDTREQDSNGDRPSRSYSNEMWVLKKWGCAL